MEYSKEITAAYNSWQKAEDNVPEEHKADYSKKNASARRQWKKFANLCVAAGLHAVTVAHDLTPKTLIGKVSLFIKD